MYIKWIIWGKNNQKNSVKYQEGEVYLPGGWHSAGQSGRRALRPSTTAQFVQNLAEKAPALVNAAVTHAKPRLAIFWSYAQVELVPPTPAEIPTAIQSLKTIINSGKTGSFKQLTVKEALLNGLVVTEVWMWFYVGEITGKRFEDQFLTCDYICLIIQVFLDHVWADCYLNKIRQCVRKKKKNQEGEV